MSAKSLVVSLLLIVAWPCAHAGPVYKIVGPDGRVTFSDTPPAEAANGTYQIMGSQGSAAAAPAPEQPHSADSQANETRVAASAAPKQASRAWAPDAIQSDASPELEGAVIGVLGIEDIVKRTEDVCVETLPTSFSTYAAAVAAWQARNGTVVARAREVLASEFDTPTREAIAAGLRLKNDGLFTPVRAASAAARISWCDESFATMSNGKMDVHANPKLTAPLAGQ